jgi:hypothetical protein
MTSLFGSILPGNGDTFEGLDDDDDSEDRADDDGTDDEQTNGDTDG